MAILTGCGKNNKQLKKQPEQLNDFSVQVREYMKDNTGDANFEVTDSIKLVSLNSIIYKVDNRGIIDDDDYILIQDCGNKQIYSITNTHWPSFNSNIDKELQYQILANDASGKNIEPINFLDLGIEAFINRSSALNKRPLKDLELDTLIRFTKHKSAIRVSKIEEIDTLISKINRKEDFTHEYEHLLRLRPLLEKKIKQKNVLLYRFGWNPYLSYFEVLPSNAFCMYDDLKREKECENDLADYYKNIIKGGFYNLKTMLIR